MCSYFRYLHLSRMIYITIIINPTMIKTLILITLLISITVSFHLKNAQVIGKVGDFLRKKTKFGDVYLHKDHEGSE